MTITPTSGLATSEAGGQATFTVVLDAQPTGEVTIALSSSDATEGSVSPAKLIFTHENWNAPQAVTVTGVDDDEADGPVAFSVVTAAAESTDSRYDGLDADDVSLTNTDDETPGMTVTPTTGLTTSEAGGQATFTVVLHARPTADVVVPILSSDEGEGTVSPSSLAFTPENWNAPQTVTVTGVDDDEADGAASFTVVVLPAQSTDAGYLGLDGDDVSLTNADDESAGVTVLPTTGLETHEAGGQATFVVTLSSKPTADVTIPLASSDEGEGTVSPSSLTFTPENWNAPQTVTVTGQDDDLADGNQPYFVVTGETESSDAGYAGLPVDDVSVSNTDDETAGFAVNPTSGLVTTEAGGQATFTVALTAQPTGDVTVPVASSDEGEALASPSSLTFTAENWNAPQAVTLTGVDDAAADGNQPFSVVLGAASSSDAAFDGLDPADVSGSNTDDETAGFTVSPTSGLTTSEAGGQATFTVALNSKPSANVTIPVSSGDATEGTASPSSLTFTPDNWNAPQVVTVTGVDDQEADGNQAYSVVLGAASSTDADYSGKNPDDVSLSNTDNDTPGFTVSPTSGLETHEAGGQATFTVVLNTQPTSDVTVPVSSSDATEGTASPSSLVFTPENWNAPQAVTVTGVNDDLADGSQGYSIVLGAASSADAGYAGKDPVDVSVTNTDDDSPGVTVSPTSGLETTEAGGQATFTIVLNSQPSADVTIPLASSDESEGAVLPTSVTFTPDNWNAPQAIVVTGQDDALPDGSQAYAIVTGAAASADAGYEGIDPADVALVNVDDESPGITVSPTSGLVTREDGTGSASFTIVLNYPPTADVVVPLSVSHEGEGAVSPAEVVFTPANWNEPQTVNVSGKDDAVVDGDRIYMVLTAPAQSADAGYAGLNASDVEVTNIDDETAGFTIEPITGLVTDETGLSATFRVRLNSNPSASVTLGLSSSDATEGTVSPASLTFTGGAEGDWKEFKTVTVTGMNDDLTDGDQIYFVRTDAATSGDPRYDGLDPADVRVTNRDDDPILVTFSPAGGLETTEAGGTATFTVALNVKPAADVLVPLAIDGATDAAKDEGTVSPAGLVFTPENWNVPQTVTVTGVNDDEDDGDMAYSVKVGESSSDDPYFQGRRGRSVPVTNVDDDASGITVTPTSGLQTTEAGGTATFTIVLSSQPSADVTIPLTSSKTGEGTVSPGSVLFTPGNWNVPQTVTATGVNDDRDDGNVTYQIATAAAVSEDPSYGGVNPANVNVTNVDDDTSGYVIEKDPFCGKADKPSLETSETGDYDCFRIRLTSEPYDDVQIPISSDTPSEGTVSPSSVTFTASDWSSFKRVIVTGVNETLLQVKDGNVNYTVVLGAPFTTDEVYALTDPPDHPAINFDND